MLTTSAVPPSISDILNASISGSKLPEPTNIVYKTEYGCPDYVNTVKSWQAEATKDPKHANSFTLDLQNSKDID